MDFLETIVVSNQDLLRQRLGRETLVITGASRGGTSMVAYAMLKLGYPLLSTGQRNHEHSEIVAAWESESERAKLVAENNRTHRRWGFKLPAAALYPAWCARSLRDPVFILVYRNPLAIGRSKLSRNSKLWTESAEGMEGAIQHGLQMMASGTEILRQDIPVVLVDFDAVKARANVFLEEIAHVFDLCIPKDEAQDIGIRIALRGYNEV